MTPARRCRRAIGLSAVAGLVWAGVASAQSQRELWITPVPQGTMVAVGSWAVSSKGDVHFSLAVPDEATWVSTARVAVIAQSDTVMTYDVTMAHSSGGLSQDAYTDGQAAVGPIVLVAGQVHEIDVRFSRVIRGLRAQQAPRAVHRVRRDRPAPLAIRWQVAGPRQRLSRPPPGHPFSSGLGSEPSGDAGPPQAPPPPGPG